MKTKVKFKPRGARVKVTLSYEAARDLARLLRDTYIPSLFDLEDGLEWTGVILKEVENG